MPYVQLILVTTVVFHSLTLWVRRSNARIAANSRQLSAIVAPSSRDISTIQPRRNARNSSSADVTEMKIILNRWKNAKANAENQVNFIS
jgi:hypothetical protein